MRAEEILDSLDKELNTTPCPIGKRVIAYFIDNFLLGIPASILLFSWVAVTEMQHLNDDIGTLGMTLIFALVYLLSWIYHAKMESSEAGGTFGKRWMGIRVVDWQGKQLSFKHASGRFFAKIPSALIPFRIGYFMAFAKSGQALHDRLANTLVVNAHI